jgi:hypothetical protein
LGGGCGLGGGGCCGGGSAGLRGRGGAKKAKIIIKRTYKGNPIKRGKAYHNYVLNLIFKTNLDKKDLHHYVP